MADAIAFEDMKRILVESAGLDEESIVDDPDVTFEEMGLDSLAFVEVQLAIQQEYGFEIPDEDAAELVTLGQGIDYVNRRLQGVED